MDVILNFTKAEKYFSRYFYFQKKPEFAFDSQEKLPRNQMEGNSFRN